MANRVFSSQNLTEVTYNYLNFCLIEARRSGNWPVMLIILNSLLLSANKPCLNLTDSTKWFLFGTPITHSRTNILFCFDNELSEVKQPIFFIWDKGGHLTESYHVMEPYCKLRHELCTTWASLSVAKTRFFFFQIRFREAGSHHRALASDSAGVGRVGLEPVHPVHRRRHLPRSLLRWRAPVQSQNYLCTDSGGETSFSCRVTCFKILSWK